MKEIKLVNGKIEFSTKLNKKHNLKFCSSLTFDYINKMQAIEIVNHLNDMFNIYELMPFIKKILSRYNATPDEWDELDSICTTLDKDNEIKII